MLWPKSNAEFMLHNFSPDFHLLTGFVELQTNASNRKHIGARAHSCEWQSGPVSDTKFCCVKKCSDWQNKSLMTYSQWKSIVGTLGRSYRLQYQKTWLWFWERLLLGPFGPKKWRNLGKRSSMSFRCFVWDVFHNRVPFTVSHKNKDLTCVLALFSSHFSHAFNCEA